MPVVSSKVRLLITLDVAVSRETANDVTLGDIRVDAVEFATHLLQQEISKHGTVQLVGEPSVLKVSVEVG